MENDLQRFEVIARFVKQEQISLYYIKKGGCELA